mmetsp:Transcript_67424/g.173616  ORF Transcript_67424/g.173616 Transcript_67424/m.173616 type:complete len:512 (+) Transcript_67424:740-2275(+)
MLRVLTMLMNGTAVSSCAHSSQRLQEAERHGGAPSSAGGRSSRCNLRHCGRCCVFRSRGRRPRNGCTLCNLRSALANQVGGLHQGLVAANPCSHIAGVVHVVPRADAGEAAVGAIVLAGPAAHPAHEHPAAILGANLLHVGQIGADVCHWQRVPRPMLVLVPLDAAPHVNLATLGGALRRVQAVAVPVPQRAGGRIVVPLLAIEVGVARPGMHLAAVLGSLWRVQALTEPVLDLALHRVVRPLQAADAGAAVLHGDLCTILARGGRQAVAVESPDDAHRRFGAGREAAGAAEAALRAAAVGPAAGPIRCLACHVPEVGVDRLRVEIAGIPHLWASREVACAAEAALRVHPVRVAAVAAYRQARGIPEVADARLVGELAVRWRSVRRGRGRGLLDDLDFPQLVAEVVVALPHVHLATGGFALRGIQADAAAALDHAGLRVVAPDLVLVASVALPHVYLSIVEPGTRGVEAEAVLIGDVACDAVIGPALLIVAWFAGLHLHPVTVGGAAVHRA